MHVKEPSSVLIAGRKLAYDEVCPADPADVNGAILLLAGLGSKRLAWARQLAVFGRQYRTIAVDYRDTGDSDEVAEPYTVADLADDAAAVLRALSIERTHVVGISLGGFTALQFALRHANLLDRLVLVSTSAGGRTHVQPSAEIVALLAPSPGVEAGERAIHTYRRIMASDFVAAHPEELERIADTARYRSLNSAAYMRQLTATLAHDVADSLQRISAPTLVIHGDLDPLVPPANGAYLASHIAGARRIVYPGVGHIPIVERADEFNRDVLAFLAAADQTDAQRSSAEEAAGNATS